MQRAFQPASLEVPPPVTSTPEPAAAPASSPPEPGPSAVQPSAPVTAAPRTSVPGMILEGRGRSVRLAAGDHLVGRSPECALQLEGRSISRRHALIRIGADGGSIRDLGSANGTFVNGRRAEETTPLSPGDEVKFGEHSFHVRALDSLPADPAPPR